MKILLAAAIGIAIAAAASACGSSSSGPDNNGTPDAGGTDTGGGGVDAPSDSPVTPTDGGSDAPVGPSADAGPISAPANQWTWVPFADAKCRDGSTTGIGVNINPASTKVMIFLEGGGACFNAITCGQNPSSFGDADFAKWTPGRGVNGVFNRTDAANPVKDWSWVYVPYCTGDVHGGNNPTGTVSGISATQAFVGYVNVGLYLDRVVPTFPSATYVLLTGVSAGGFGAGANYPQVAKAFGSIPVDMLDDSGPYMQDPYAATCLQAQLKTLWGLDKTVLADCGADCNDPNFMIASSKHIAKTYPNRKFGLIDSVGDNTIRGFLGFGAQNCTSFSQLTADQYQAGLFDIRTQLASATNFGSFYFAGTEHTSIAGPTLDSRTAGGEAGTVKLSDWMTAFVGGTVTNVGP
jgi:hypothetical protein